MSKARIFSLSDYPDPDQDDAGQLLIYDDFDDADCEPETVVVKPHLEGWIELVGVEPIYN